MSEQLTSKTPGKLMVAGEFAVLEPGHSLVVMAVNRFVYVTIADTKQNKVSLTDFKLFDLAWQYADEKVHIDSEDARTDFVERAMGVTLTYLAELGVNVTPFSLSIKSELDDESGLKYGLGSSAAVVTGVVTAILQKFIGADVHKVVIFKLASITHVSVQGNGSCADIAASTYGGILHYTAFQTDWLLAFLENESSVKQIVESKWNHLSIEEVSLPAGLELTIGWTGAPASTGSLVKEIQKLKEADQQTYDTFLCASKFAVEAVLVGMKTDNKHRFLDGIEKNRIALAELGSAAEAPIETEHLQQLSMEAKRLGGAGKLSGAGGGDCGIAFVDSSEKVAELNKAWTKKSIKVLYMLIYAR